MVNSVIITTNTTIIITTTNPTTISIYWPFWVLWLKCVPKDF